MTTDLDRCIREHVSDVMASAPPAPTFDELNNTTPGVHTPVRRRLPAPMLAGAVAVGILTLVVGAVFVRKDDPKPPAVQPATTSPTPYQLDIVSLPTLKLEYATYEAPAGPVQINFVSRGGFHSLAITGPGLSVTPLVQASDGAVASTVIDLAPGTYFVYCDVPGHREAGEQATLVVR